MACSPSLSRCSSSKIKVPHLPYEASNHELWAALHGAWPSFLALVISFTAILVMWVNHHGLLNLIQGVNVRFLFANGFLLLLIMFVPFPTAVLAEYLNREAANTAAVLYCGTYVLISPSPTPCCCTRRPANA